MSRSMALAVLLVVVAAAVDADDDDGWAITVAPFMKSMRK